jgi:hypothetical protein
MKELNEDIEFYNKLMEDFKNLDSSDYSTAYVLSQEALITADRWNEIMLDSVKYAKQMEITKSEFTNYCYQKYKILMKAHEMCRMVYRQGVYGITNNFYNEEV